MVPLAEPNPGDLNDFSSSWRCSSGATRRSLVVEPAETGRPETSREFARRVRDRLFFAALANKRRGGKTAGPQQANQSQPSPLSECETVISDDLRISLTFLDEDNLMGKLKNHYGQNSFFKLALDEPAQYRNFEIVGGYI